MRYNEKDYIMRKIILCMKLSYYVEKQAQCCELTPTSSIFIIIVLYNIIVFIIS